MIKDAIKQKTTLYFSAFDNKTKENGYYYKEMGKRRPVLTRWVMEPMTL